MARIKGAMATRKRRKKVLKAAKGYYVYRREAKGKKYTKWKKVKNIKKNRMIVAFKIIIK